MPVAAQPDLGPQVPSLMSWLYDSSPRARQFREQLNTDSAQLAAVRQNSVLALKLREQKQLQAPLPPAEENAALDYLHLQKLLLKDKPLKQTAYLAADRLAWGAGVSAEEEQEARELLATRGDVLEIIDSAASKKQCVFKRDWSKGPELELSEYSIIRHAVTLLCARQILLLSDGRPLEAAKQAPSIYRMAEHAASDPLIISYLMGLVCEQMEMRVLGEVLRRGGSRESVSTAVRDAIVQARPRLDFRRAIEGEFIQAHAQLEMLREADPKKWTAWLNLSNPGQLSLYPTLRVPGEFTPKERLFLTAVLDAVEARWLQQTQNVLSSNDLLSTMIQREVTPSDPLAAPRRMNPVEMLDGIYPTFSKMATRAKAVQMQAARLLAACDVLIYKAQHGAFPTHLEQAQTPATLEALNNQRLHYRRENEGFMLQDVNQPEENNTFRYP